MPQCPHCAAEVIIPAKLAAQPVRCGRCGEPFVMRAQPLDDFKLFGVKHLWLWFLAGAALLCIIAERLSALYARGWF